jgi:hypothetical protein
MRLQHLLAFALLSRDPKLPASTRFLLLFVQGFGQYAGPGQPSTFSNTPATRLARFCFRLLAPAVRSGRVVLAAETRGMQDELQRFTGLPVSLFPHPVPAPSQGSGIRGQGTGVRGQESGDRGQESGDRHQESGDRRQESGGNGQEAAFVDHEPRTKDQGRAAGAGPSTKDQGPAAGAAQSTRHKAQITITCPGFARHEKGNDLLQEAILEILAGPEGDRFHFIMQWPEPFAMPDGRLLGPDPRLLADPRVEFLNHSLDAVAYEALLARSNLILQPYRSNSYRQRVSRVAIEAASRGIPLVYTANTWSAEVACLAEAGVAIAAETPAEVVVAIRKAVESLPRLGEAARTGAPKVIAYHSNDRFRQLLLTLVNPVPQPGTAHLS